MCGIAGTVSHRRSSSNLRRAEESLNLMLHRGPDDRGLWSGLCSEHNVVFGQTRLSIIDLSSSGHQPMVSRDERYVLTFNGEIYNYRELRAQLEGLGFTFRGASDTEVLLQAWIAWGESALHKFEGMFAFAILDREENQMTCVRDAFGIKPLFYSNTETDFFFASELSALRALIGDQPVMNQTVMLDYLSSSRYDLRPETFFEGLVRLNPGHLLVLDLNESSFNCDVKRWWWPSVRELAPISFSDAVHEVRERFLNNVRIHLRSDVPLGIALSGGIDSSAIASAVRLLEPEVPILTFSFVAPGSPVDEESWIDVVNDSIGAEPHKVILSADGLVQDIDAMIAAQGEPFGSTSIYAQFRVYRAAREAGVTVMLDGQGADELFAGYHGYPASRVRSLVRSGNLLGASRLMRGWSHYPGRTKSEAVQHSVAGILPQQFIPYAKRISGRSRTPDWINPRVLHDMGLSTFLGPGSIGTTRGRFLSARLREALTLGEMAVLLRHGDRNSMHWSVESRVPFLTTQFAEFVLSLPEQYLLSPDGQTKLILREAMRGITPDLILNRRDKIGFQTPEQDWLRQLRPFMEEWLQGLSQIPFIDSARAMNHVSAVLEGRQPFDWQIWRIINASRWVQVNFA